MKTNLLLIVRLVWVGLLLLLGNCNLPGLDRSILESLSTMQFFNRPTGSYVLGFQVNHLQGAGLVVANGSEAISVSADGVYEFARRFSKGQEFHVTISSQPNNPAQVCTVLGGTGVFAQGDIRTVQIECATEIPLVSIVGSVGNLQGSGLILEFSGSEASLSVPINGSSFALPSQPVGSTYSLSLSGQPSLPQQICSILAPDPPNGILEGLELSIELVCNTVSFPLTLDVTGIIGALTPGNELQIQVNGGEILTFSANGIQSFPTAIDSGMGYTVAILNPGGVVETGVCSVALPSGTMVSPGVTVAVVCSSNFVVSGTVTTPGLSPSSILGTGGMLRLVNTGGTAFANQDIPLAPGNVNFAFPTPIPLNAQYEVVVIAQPTLPIQTCSLTGTVLGIASGPISDLVLDCNLPEPQFSVIPNIYYNDVVVSLSPPLPGVEVKYTIGDGAQLDPTCPGIGITYSVPITLIQNSENTLKVISCAPGWAPSVSVSSGAYQLTVADPIPSSGAGSFLNQGSIVSHSMGTSGSWVCTTQDVAPSVPVDPSCGASFGLCAIGISGDYSHPGGFERNVKFLGCRDGYNSSAVVSANYLTNSFTVGGSVSGLPGSFAANSFVLQNNGGDNLVVSADGSFSFATPIPSGGTYNVTVLSHPQNPWYTCSVTDGSGTVTTSNVVSVSISCNVQAFSLSGNVTSESSLPPGLVLGNGWDSVVIPDGSANTPFAFATPLDSGTIYDMQIISEPEGWACTIVSDLRSEVYGTNITDLSVNCIVGFRWAGSVISRRPAILPYLTYQAGLTPVAGDGFLPGYVDAFGSGARFQTIMGGTFDGKKGYLADMVNHAIRVIDPMTGSVTTLAGNGTPGFADGGSGDPVFNHPCGITTDGTYLYVVELLGARLKRTHIQSGFTETLAGDGTVLNPSWGQIDSINPLDARFYSLTAVALDGEVLYISDTFPSIRTYNLRTREVATLTTLPGGSPAGIVVVGDYLYVTDELENRILRIDKQFGTYVTFAGRNQLEPGFRDDIGTMAKFNGPYGITSDGNYLYVTDHNNYRIRRIDIQSQRVTTLAGNGTMDYNDSIGIQARMVSPSGIINVGDGIAVGDMTSLRFMEPSHVLSYYPLANSLQNYRTNSSLSSIGPVSYGLGLFNEPNGSVVTGAGYLQGDVSAPTMFSVSHSIWFMMDGTMGGDQYLFYNGISGSNGGGLGVRSGSNRLFLKIDNWEKDLGFILESGVYYHIAWIRDGFSNDTVYLNGKPIYKGLRAGVTPTGFLFIGGDGIGNNFRGNLANYRAYNKVLGEGEVQELARQADMGLVHYSASNQSSQLYMHYILEANNNAHGFIGTALSVIDSPPSFARGKEGELNTAYRLDGFGYLVAGGDGLPVGDSPRSACLWIKPERLPNAFETITLLKYGNSGTNGEAMVMNLWHDGSTVQLQFGANGMGQVTGIVNISLQTWTHLCGTYDGEWGGLYVNGDLINFVNLAGAFNTVPGNLLIGSLDGANRYQGKIDDVRIYGEGLDWEEVRTLAAQISVGLMARYDMQWNDGHDTSGFQNHAWVNGTTQEVGRNGHWPGSARFNGVSNYWDVFVHFGLPSAETSRTICSWVRATAPVKGVIANYGGLVSVEGFGISLDEDEAFVFTNTDGVASSHYHMANVWTHFCGTYDPLSQQAKIFMNGRLLKGTTHSWDTTQSNFLMGARLDFSPAGYFQGDVDEVVLYNRELSLSEIQALSGYHPWQGGSWNPDTASNALQIHLQADSLSNLGASDPVTLWQDRSGKNRHFGSASPPAYYPYEINFRPGVFFSSSLSNYMTFVGDPQIPTPSSTQFFVSSFDSITSGTIFQTDGPNGHSLNFLSFGFFSFDSEGEGTFNAFSTVGWSLFTPYLLALSHEDGSFAELWMDGLSHMGGTYMSRPPAPTSGTLYLGSGIGNHYLDGSLAEFLYYDGVIPGDERRLVECYLSAKYGIRLLDTGTHCD